MNVPVTATQAEIRTAYKKESLRVHPDKIGGNAERFKRLSEAYTKLMESSAAASAGASAGGAARRTDANGPTGFARETHGYGRYRRS